MENRREYISDEYILLTADSLTVMDYIILESMLLAVRFPRGVRDRKGNVFG